MSEHLGMIKLGRIGNPEDIADAALFLASDLSRYTGQILGVDGEQLYEFFSDLEKFGENIASSR